MNFIKMLSYRLHISIYAIKLEFEHGSTSREAGRGYEKSPFPPNNFQTVGDALDPLDSHLQKKLTTRAAEVIGCAHCILTLPVNIFISLHAIVPVHDKLFSACTSNE